MFDELKKRHLLQIALLYMGAGWLFIEITDFLVGNYGMSRKILDTVVLLAILGFPAFLIIGWFHGERGPQRVRRSELWMLLTLGVMGAVGSYQIVTGESIERRGDEAQGVATLDSEVPSSEIPSDSEISRDGLLASGRADRLSGPSLAILPFKNNVSDPELAWLGSGLADLLTTNFAQLGGLQVVGRQRLYDLLLEEGRTEEEEIPDQLATAVARASGARAMLWGTVSGTAEDLVIDAQIIDVETGAVQDAERIRGDDVFAMVDSLTARLVAGLGRPGDRRARPPRLSALGTRDLRALGAFHEGVALERAGRHGEAAVSFERAAEQDTTFMLPLLRLTRRGHAPDPGTLQDEGQDGPSVSWSGREVAAHRRRALHILEELGAEFQIEMEGMSNDEVLAALDSTIAQSLSTFPSFRIELGIDTTDTPPRTPNTPSR